jgi:Flp pilus assembly protein TadD
MSHMPCTPRSVLWRLAPPLTAASLALLSGACTGVSQEPAWLDSQLVASPETAETTRNASAKAGPTAFHAAPDDPRALLAEARRLRRDGNKMGAYALLEQASGHHPGERALKKERALLAVELGHLAEGKDLLTKAIDENAPDWRLHSALGAALAASGEQQEAQAQFAKALELAPEHPAVLNNLALSYALDGKHDEAERLLHRASEQGPSATAKGQAKQNLALILGLSGRTDEARHVSEAILPAPQAKANMAYLEKHPETAAAAAPVRSAHAADSSMPAPIYRLGGPRK